MHGRGIVPPLPIAEAITDLRMTPLRVVVVEDQPLVRSHLVETLGRVDGVEVVGACENGMTAVERIPELAPDLVFLDVQMPEMSGFDVIEAIGADRMPPVVFVTAYDMYALKAFEVHALDYVLKPTSVGRLTDVVERARQRLGGIRPADVARHLSSLLNHPEVSKGRDRFAIRTDGRLLFVPHRDIHLVEASGNYAIVHTASGRHIIRAPLSDVEQRLGPGFKRIHRSTIVNLHSVREMRTAGKGEYDVVMQDGRVQRVTRRFRRDLERALAELD